MPLRILIVDDHTLTRKGLKALLASDPGLYVVADTGDTAAALGLVIETNPDVVLLDVSPSGRIGIGAVRHVQRAPRRPPVVALSTVADEHHVAQALEHGAAGYLSKADPPEELCEAIRAVAAGRIYVTSRISRAAGPDPSPPADDPLRHLTAREREIFGMVVHGASTLAIARELAVSPRTVETHRAHLLRKLGVHCAADLVRFAARNGLLPA